MNVYILNGNLEKVAVIDTFKSLIWTKRYYEAGDFELYIPADKELLQYLSIGNYVMRDDDDKIMIIQHIEITTDVEIGDFFTISGYSVEILLKRRVISGQVNMIGSAEAKIRQLVIDNATIPSDVSRTLTKVSVASLKGYPELINSQVSWVNLYDEVVTLCKKYYFGWKMTLNNSKFRFEIYKGTDHSYSQSVNPYVIFSPDYDNLINSHYLYDTKNFSNVAYIAGEGEGTARKSTHVGNSAGMNRYEMFVDARDISSNDGEIGITEYMPLLAERGWEKLKEAATLQQTFDSVTAETTFKYKNDWNIGDVVQIENEYGITASPRIVEIIESFSESGYTAIPTFEEWEVLS